ncbi:metallophosphoesterase family protein [Haloarcula sp. GH36]|uniref:metallophosphoesterase family protein n=1 Tax=Haloarcula montana TaxID=3111776 RepID=UPI002D78251F|nr:metallophosphoesterase family protein [Haloarcula sp. GH36]
MEIAIVSDTHIPSRASEIPAPFQERIEAADHVIHAGDFDSDGALSNVRAMSARLTAAAGNMDPRIGLPETATVELGGVTFVVTHGTGSRRGYEDRVADTVRREAGADAVGVAGHTHELLDTVHDGVRLLNPGSATGAPPADRTTMLTADVSDGDLSLTVHER